MKRSGRHPAADRPFFLLAALHAALMVPLWVLARLGIVTIPALADPARHGHEMIAGYVLAVVAGFLFTRISRPALVLAIVLWLTGRFAALLALPPPAALVTGIAFPLVLFVIAGLPFLRAARSAHNAVFAGALAGFVVVEGYGHLLPPAQAALGGLGVAALLVFAMGGRVIPAATAGAVRAKGGVLAARVQPGLEWTGFAALGLAVVLDLTGIAPMISGVAALIAGMAALGRLARWRTAAVLDDAALWGLHLGYFWLGLGLGIKGAAQLGALPPAGALHALAVGALGSVPFAMMARTVLQRRQRTIVFPRWLTGCVALVSLAAVLRLAALAPGLYAPALAGAAIAWSAAFLGLAVFVLRRAG